MSTIPTKEQTARQIWLLYFNRTLLERGIITEKEHNQMKVKIQGERRKICVNDKKCEYKKVRLIRPLAKLG